jgi:hypothetical protein
MYQPLKNRMVQARYHQFSRGWQAAEFTYTPFHWKAEHRYVAVRRPAAMEPEEIQKRLFTFKDYTYHRALVTNLELTPEAVWRLYCDRAFQELLLREFKGAYAMAKIPTPSFWANATYMEIILWAYDLVLAFQSLCLPEEVRQWNISTLRRELWCLPAEWGQERQSQPPDPASQVSSSGPLSENRAGQRENQTDYLNQFATVLTTPSLVRG